MDATIIAIGDELLLGKTVNNNAAFLSRRFAGLGIGVRRQVVVGDVDADITAALDEARAAAPLVVTTGGLGPTDDDRTLAAIAGHLGLDFVLHQPTLREIERRFARRGLKMPAVNVGQARVPAGSRVLANALGTAPGIIIEDGGFVACLLPGVPAEMEYIFEHGFVPYLEKQGYVGERVFERHIHVTGLPESAAAEKLAGIEVPPGIHLAYLPQTEQLDLRFWGPAPDEATFRDWSEPAAAAIRKALGSYVFGEDRVPLERVVGEALAARGATLALAESCTGGLVAKRVTDVSGASTWFAGGVVCYSNEAKQSLLGVREATLVEFGAVSEKTALEMAEGARERFGATYAVAVTGVAGPSGGTREKPVGTTCFGLAAEGVTRSDKKTFGGGRDWVRVRASQHALDLLRLYLGEQGGPS
ncbi:MAG: competence/damage-inducible protein A [Candidatus Zixiibacteriota bacterium]|jgi:nicotinamide-nucleotide amidase